jgi:hypothetical protein
VPHERLSAECLEALRHHDSLSPDRFEEIQSVLTAPVRTQAELQPSYHVAIQSKLTYDLISTLRRMDQTNAALTRKLLWLTVILVVLTVILAADAFPHFIEWVKSWSATR